MLILLGILYAGIILCTFFITLENGLDSFSMFPKEFEDTTECNLLGRVILSFISILINPITLVARFLYWCTHVKKKG